MHTPAPMAAHSWSFVQLFVHLPAMGPTVGQTYPDWQSLVDEQVSLKLLLAPPHAAMTASAKAPTPAFLTMVFIFMLTSRRDERRHLYLVDGPTREVTRS